MRLLLLFFLLFSLFPLRAQYPVLYPPLNFKLDASGGFCQIRSNHFHSGIDLRTQQKEGLPVFAADDGYVSRIYMQPRGYGNMIAITHPSGFTTVYAHLQSFIPEIQELAFRLQVEKQSLTLDTNLSQKIIPVKRGQLIGYSGNTGSSTGPHLHFEVRETATNIALDPMDFGLNIADTQKPEFHSFYLYPLDPHARLGKMIPLPASISASVPLAFPTGTYGLACTVSDRMDASSFKHGVRRLTLYAANTKIFEIRLQQIDFTETRYINAHVDYGESLKGNKIRRLFILPNDLFSAYESALGNGFFKLQPDETLQLRVEAEDARGNIRSQRISLRGKPAEQSLQPDTFAPNVKAGQAMLLEQDMVSIRISEKSFYQDERIQIRRIESQGPYGYPVWQIGEEYIPLHEHVEIRISAGFVPQNLRKYAVGAVRYKGKWTACPTRWEEPFFIIKTNDLGPYTLCVDSIPPTFQAPDLGATLKAGKWLVFKARDNFSGLDSGALYFNGRFIPGEQLADGSFKFRIPSDISGSSSLLFLVRDRHGNENRWEKMVEILP